MTIRAMLAGPPEPPGMLGLMVTVAILMVTVAISRAGLVGSAAG
jgi:hypothetical protein